MLTRTQIYGYGGVIFSFLKFELQFKFQINHNLKISVICLQARILSWNIFASAFTEIIWLLFPFPVQIPYFQ
jgi:hypothetical protein